jgi:hypothetical protein
LSGATDFVKAKAKTQDIKVFIPKLLCSGRFQDLGHSISHPDLAALAGGK